MSAGSVFIVGPGRMGLALGYALAQSESGLSLTVCGRRPEPPSHPLFTQRIARYVFGLERPQPDAEAVFLAVPDAALPEMAHALAGQGGAPHGCAAFHLSGALPTDVLAPLHERGYHVGSFHPIQTIGHPVQAAQRLSGSYVAVSGSPTAVAVARRLAAAIESTILMVPEAWRSRYHAATALAASFLPPLIEVAAKVLVSAGVSPNDAVPALLPLVRGTLDDIEEMGLAGAVAGPVSRGDVETVDLHLRTLDEEDRRLYAVLAHALTRLAGTAIDDERREEILERLEAEVSR